MSKVVGVFQSLWAQPATAVKQEQKFGKSTTKIVGKPLSVLYGTATLHGNIVYLRQYDSDHHRTYFVALCWGPVAIDQATVKINSKFPQNTDGHDYSAGQDALDNVYATTSAGWRGDNSEDLPNTPWPVAYGMNRAAYLWVRGLANPTFSSLDSVTCVATRPKLLDPSGDGADYDTPIPSAIAAAYPAGIRSANPVAAALDYLLNRDYGPGVPAASFGDCATWLAAIAYGEAAVLNPDGTHEPRYSIGLEVGASGEGSLTHEAIVEKLLDHADCKAFESGGIVKVWQARPQSPVSLALDDSNFEPSGFATSDLKDRPNLVEVTYQQADDGEARSVSWLDDAGIDVSGENRATLDLPGCPTRTQAARRARLEGRRAIAEAKILEGEAAPAARALEPGDVVAVTLRDAESTWYSAKPFRVTDAERTDGDRYGLRLTLQEYGGDALFDDGQDNVLESNDPILKSPAGGMPSPLSKPGPAQAGVASVDTILDQDGRVTHAGELAWQASGEPAYMHQAWHVYRRLSLADAWARIGSSAGAPYFRDVGAPVLSSDVYYGVTAVTSAGVEGDVPALWTAVARRLDPSGGVDPSSISFSYGSKVTGQDGLYAWLEVDWAAADDASRYQVFYRFDGGPMTPVTEEDGTSARIEPAHVGLYEVTVVALGQDGQRSGEATADYLLQDGGWDVPDQPQALALLGDCDVALRRFLGRDCRVGWRPPAGARFSGPQLDHYEIEASIQGRVVRTESTVDTSWTYPWDHNLADSAQFATGSASRALSLAVYAVDRTGRRSPPATLDVANPQAGLPTTVSVRQGMRSCVLEVEAPAESDLAGLRVVLGADPGFDPQGGSYRLVADGVDTHVVVTLAPGEVAYAKAAFYDAFGKDGLLWTTAYGCSAPKLIGEEIEAASITAENLADDVTAALEAGGVTVVGSLPSLPDDKFPTGSQAYLLGTGKIYRNAEGTWTASADGRDLIANSIVAGKFQAGAIGADDLAANSFTARHAAFGDFSNICVNPTFEQGLDGWRVVGGQTSYAVEAYGDAGCPAGCPAPHALAIVVPAGGSSRLYWKELQVEAGDTYYLSAQVARTGTSLREVALGGFGTDNAGSTSVFLDAPSGSPTGRLVPPAGAWAKVEWTVTVPTGVTRLTPSLYVTTATDAASTYHVTLVRVRKMTDSVLIEDGTVTAAKCVAKLIRAGSALIDTAAIDSAMINDLDAGKLRAGSVLAGNVNVAARDGQGSRLQLDGATGTLRHIISVGSPPRDVTLVEIGKLADGTYGIVLRDGTGAQLFGSGVGLNVGNNSGFGPFATSGPIDAANVGDLIASGAIGGTQIANAAIGNAHIDNLAVGTLQVMDGAITNPASIYDAGRSNSSAGSLDSNQCVITTSGGSLFLFASFGFTGQANNTETITVSLRRDNSSISQTVQVAAVAISPTASLVTASGQSTLAYVDTPTADTHSYRVRVSHPGGFLSYSKCTIFALEFKK